MSAPISGMTGFGRAEGASGDWTWTIESRSVNGKGLEIKARTPGGLDGLDRIARELAQARFQRGQVSVTIQARRIEAEGQVRINEAVLDQYLTIAREIMDKGAEAPRADGILALRGVIEVEGDDAGDDQTTVETKIAGDLAAALDGLKAARLDEGGRLKPLLDGFLDQIEALTQQAREEADAQTTAIRARFAKRVTELTDGAAGLEERVFQEAAMQAARADVREELDRLDAHVASARALVHTGGAVGRRMDFLSQEFMREANTLCSKAATLPLTAAGLDLKAVIEQLREQVQNVE